MDLIAADIGGTHARFALARVDGGRVTLSHARTLRTAEHASLELAWATYTAALPCPAPRVAGIAVACPVGGEALKLTNNPWVIQPALLGARLGLDAFTLLNDFAAVAHAVAIAPPEDLPLLCGPDAPLPADGVTTVLGPGTGLGVAQLVRGGGPPRVLATEGGHIDWAPLDAIDDAVLAQLRARFRRVSVERVACGPGLMNIYGALAALEGVPVAHADDAALWTAALEGRDGLANAAFDRFAQALGGVAGDLALAHGAGGVVLAGGLGARIAHRLPNAGFHERFCAKGRFEAMMRRIPVRRIATPEPGLVGAAAAAARA